jgi:predicted DNA-binding transcriptional regulator YafY
VEISSAKGSKGLTEEIYPYALVYHSNCLPQGWVLIGYSPCIKEFKGLKLAPDFKITLSSHSFQRDKSFNLQEFLDSRWGIEGGEAEVVKVRFTGEAASEVMEMNHHPKEKVISVGENEAIYTVTVKGTNGILKWILAYGSEAEVLAPNYLREQIERIAKNIIRLYPKNTREVTESKS